MGQTFLAA